MDNRGEEEKIKERITYWLDLAQYDLDTAETLLKGGRFLYVGFMCHQVMEKSLKACYVRHCGKTPPYSHNLGHLARESAIYSLLNEEQKTSLDRLEPLNIESRYPDYKKKVMEGLTFEKCEDLLKHAKELHAWLRTRL